MKNILLIEADFGRLGKTFIETSRDANSRADVVALIRSGEVRPVKVVEICEAEGWNRDVTDEIVAEVAEAEAEYAQGRKAAQALFRFDHARDYRKNGE